MLKTPLTSFSLLELYKLMPTRNNLKKKMVFISINKNYYKK